LISAGNVTLAGPWRGLQQDAALGALAVFEGARCLRYRVLDERTFANGHRVVAGDWRRGPDTLDPDGDWTRSAVDAARSAPRAELEAAAVFHVSACHSARCKVEKFRFLGAWHGPVPGARDRPACAAFDLLVRQNHIQSQAARRA